MLALFLAAVLQTQPASAATPAPIPPSVPRAGTVRVALATDQGRIVLELEEMTAPITTANFLRYVDGHRLDGIVFYRTVRVAPNYGFIQFGVQNEPRRVLPPIKHEPSTLTGVKHTDGAISLARNEPGSGRGDFTINVGTLADLDADPAKPGDNLGYAAFGHVVEGMDVVKRILDAPTATDGKGPFKGEMLAAPVTVVSARRVTPAP